MWNITPARQFWFGANVLWAAAVLGVAHTWDVRGPLGWAAAAGAAAGPLLLGEALWATLRHRESFQPVREIVGELNAAQGGLPEQLLRALLFPVLALGGLLVVAPLSERAVSGAGPTERLLVMALGLSLVLLALALPRSVRWAARRRQLHHQARASQCAAALRHDEDEE